MSTPTIRAREKHRGGRHPAGWHKVNTVLQERLARLLAHLRGQDLEALEQPSPGFARELEKRGLEMPETVKLRDILEVHRGAGTAWDPMLAGELPAGPGEVLDLVERGAEEIAERTARWLYAVAGDLVTNKPAGFKTHVLARAAERFPWDNTTSAGRLLMLLTMNLRPELPAGELLPYGWPDDMLAGDVASWCAAHSCWGDVDVEKQAAAGRMPAVRILSPDGTEGLGWIEPAGFAALFEADRHLARWHRPSSEPGGWHAAMVEGLGIEGGAADALVDELYLREQALRRRVGFPELTGKRTQATGALLSADDRLADFLKDIGDTGWELANLVRDEARERWARGFGDRKLYRLWWERGDKAPMFAELLARALWPKIERDKPEREATTALIRSVRQGDSLDDIVKVEKVVGGITWALGAPGVEIPGVIDIDGAKYPKTPRIARYRTRAFPVLRPSKGPAQQVLPLDLMDCPEVPFGLELVGYDAALISPTASKFLLLAVVTALKTRRVKAPIGEVTRVLNPDRPRIQARDNLRTALAAYEIGKRVEVVYPKGGGKFWTFPLLVVSTPWNEGDLEPDQELSWTFSPFFLDLIKRGEYKPFRGQFVMNLTGYMRLSAREAPQGRLYLYGCGSWNDARDSPKAGGRFNPERLQYMSPRALGARANILSAGAVEYDQKKDARKRSKLADDLRATKDNLERLEAHGLIELARVGKGRHERFKMLPPEPLLEAYELHRDRKRVDREFSDFGLAGTEGENDDGGQVG